MGDEAKPSLDDFVTKEKKETSYTFPISEKPNIKKMVQVSKFKGKGRVDLRDYFMGEDGEWHATKKGISIDVEQFEKLESLVPLIKEALDSL